MVRRRRAHMAGPAIPKPPLAAAPSETPAAGLTEPAQTVAPLPATANLPSLFSQLSLLQSDGIRGDEHEVSGAPVFTESVRQYCDKLVDKPFKQFGLLGGEAVKMSPKLWSGKVVKPSDDPRVYYNVAAPSSVFICGSQGSGKSHTLSCLLENCLLSSDANVLPHPLTGIVLHYDTFVSEAGGSPCEAAFLSSSNGVKVRVLCPPTNIVKIRSLYKDLPNVVVEELRLDESDLNTKRMLDLMAVSSVQGGGMPLYLHVVTRILRELRIVQQVSGGAFNYTAFKRALDSVDLTPGQMAPLQQRLDTLESFMVKQQVQTANWTGKKKGAAPPQSTKRGNDWTPKAGQLTIIDLSCPCITQESACALFNICLSLFLEQDTEVGRVIALDEAHKFMTDSEECVTLTETLLATIRLQRHLGTRVVISTQEPTISPKLLDLCSITIVHRFTSPDWFRSLKRHLAGANVLTQGDNNPMDSWPNGEASPAPSLPRADQSDFEQELLSQILALRTGEALLFAPTAMVAVSVNGSLISFGSEDSESDSVDTPAGAALNKRPATLTSLGPRPMKIGIRKRITEDGGRTIMAA
ncbi:hypothetical protein HIM_00978 [Hirsutella minnesotensis 3608]|nr:hypothetical protein HIM_00978 [Hirsutella minnesotensis 3608]